MTCHCASNAEHEARAESARYESERNMNESKDKEIARLKAEIAASVADPTRYEILDAYDRVEGYLVVKAKFPSCTKCEFEGTKILVYQNVLPIQAMKWKRLDPHFHGNKTDPSSAPSPIARFPGTDEGWKDAILYASSKKNLR